jgi:ankyrin repeat protein
LNYEISIFLIYHGANVNHRDEFGQTPLHIGIFLHVTKAFKKNFFKIIDDLLLGGGDITIIKNK